MKKLLAVIVSMFLVVLILFSFSCCGESSEVTGEIKDTTPLIPTSVSNDSKADSAKKTEKKSNKKTKTSSAVPVSSSVDPDMQAMLEKKLESLNFNGVAIVSKNGKILCEAANGKLSSGSKRDIGLDTKFAIASCSKQFTAASVMILKEDGKLSVNDTLDKYFPEYKYGKKITIKNLLTMRSGIPDFLNDNASFSKYDVSKNASEKKNREVTRKWIFSHGLNFTPDGAYDYCNSNYFLLAEIVEKVSGKSFSEFLKERIFKPLGMNDTGSNEELGYADNLAVSERDPWDLPGAKGKNIPITIRVKGLNVGNGGLISTARDMDKWLTSLREYTILSEKSVKEMTTDYNPYADHYGYGVQVTKDGACWHVGSLDYYASYSYTVPKKGYNFFAVTNDKLSMNCDIYSFASSIINATK